MCNCSPLGEECPIENRRQEIICFFLLIAKHYQDICDEYRRADRDMWLVGRFSIDQKMKDCREMISYCTKGLKALEKDSVDEILDLLDKMVSLFTSIISHTGTSPFEIPNLMELRATKFYTENLRRNLFQSSNDSGC